MRIVAAAIIASSAGTTLKMKERMMTGMKLATTPMRLVNRPHLTQ